VSDTTLISPTVYTTEDLTGWAAAVFRACGVPDADADTTAAVLVRTNLRGIDTHGVSRIPVYAEKVLSGEVNAKAKPTSSIRDGVLYFDGDGGIGQAVATKAVRAAIAAAKQTSVLSCVITNSGHLAAIGMFVLEAAEAGLVAVLCQETPPLMALAGSPRPAIGNNPIAFAAPVRDGAPLVFDMATSAVARGSVLDAVREGTELPQGWAIGPDGEPTTDPATALKGSMLPIAGHKGIGLAMMVQVLAGSLSGSTASASATKFGAQSSAGNVSAFLLLLNPDRMLGRRLFDDHVAGWIADYKAASGPGARYPGERAAQSERDRAVAGIPVSDAVVQQLRTIGEQAGIPFTLEPFGSTTSDEETR
jgi:LDH2 family malate/lactate/ureidoglycolate dehydrogenase